MKHNFKAKIGNLLLIGGVAYIVLRTGNLFDSLLLNLIIAALHLIWVAFFITILFKNHLVLLAKFNANYPCISLFLKWIGGIFYFILPKIIMLMIGGCEDYTNTLISSYFEISTIVPWIICPLGLLAALRRFLNEKRQVGTHPAEAKTPMQKTDISITTKFKSKISNLLIIGGFAELLLQLAYLNDNFIFDVISGFIFPFFIISIIVVLILPKIVWINKFNAHFPKTSLFLKWIGILAYLSFPLYLSMLEIGYEQAMQIYGDQNSKPIDFVTIYGAFLQILEYIFYSLGLLAVLKKFYNERKLNKFASTSF